ncbi:MAG TPA: helix-turn-helix transcriptional regulator [Candidatus Aquilonibacter sp.]|nr:helix-turn-helix transcriptional regulator [Candidatus Aquilonibacter sp.]
MAELLGTFEQIVLLAVIRQGSEAYGRSILREVEEVFSGARSVAAGAVYATLDRLETKGLLSSKLGEGTAERGGRKRRYYRVTATGFRALNEARSTLESLWNSIRWPVEVRP